MKNIYHILTSKVVFYILIVCMNISFFKTFFMQNGWIHYVLSFFAFAGMIFVIVVRNRIEEKKNKKLMALLHVLMTLYLFI